MAKITIIHTEPKDKEGFEKYYYDVHLPIVKKLPNLKNLSVSNVLNASNIERQPYLVVELEFNSLEDLKESMKSNEGMELQKDTPNLTPYLSSPPMMITTNSK